MEISAGLLILKDNNILLCHPTNSPWKKSFSIPKGKVEKFDIDLIDTAIRETKEEVGLSIDRSLVNEKERIILYKNKKGKIYKKVYYFISKINFDVDLTLQKSEVDFVKFFSKEEAEDLIFWRFEEMLSFLE